MSLRSRISTWWRAVRRHADVDAQVDEGLRFHIESYAEDLVRRGVPREEAARRAKAELGSLAATREKTRQAWGTRGFDEVRGDLRYAVRMLAKSPGFALIAVGSLALGIGANTAIFSIAKHVLLDRLDVPHPTELRLFAWRSGPRSAVHSSWGDWDSTPQGVSSTVFSYPVYEQLQNQNHELADLFAFKRMGRTNVTVNGEAEVVQGDLVSGNFYQQMEVQPQLGRAIGEADDHVGAPPVAVISDAYWDRRFNRSPSAIGTTMMVNLVPVTIVGVNPRGFTGADGTLMSPEIFLPISLQPALVPDRTNGSLLTSDRRWWIQIMARAKPGTDVAKARARLDVALEAAVRATMTPKKDESIPQLVLTDGSRGENEVGQQLARPLWSLMALVGLVVLLACANMANLMLSRAAARQREMSVRLALGAGWRRILRQMMTESLLLAALGGVAGLAVGWLGRNAILAMLSSPAEPVVVQGGFDWSVFAFNAALSLMTGLLFGVAPAWKATRTEVSTTLKESAQTATKRRHGYAGKAIVGFQVALSTLLVVAAGIFLRTLINLDEVNPGFDTKDLVLFELRPPVSEYTGEKQIQLFHQITDRLAAAPGVESVSLTSVPPLSNSYDSSDFTPIGAKNGPSRDADNATVGDAYFTTFRIPIVAGRGFAPTDTETSPKVAVVNRALVKEFFPNGSAIGKSFTTSGAKDNKLTYQIVGICADTHYGSLRKDPPPVFYLDYLQAPEDDWGMAFAVRTRVSRAAITPELRRAVQAVDRNLPLTDVRTQQEQIDELLMNERIFANLTSGFGVLALVLASIGIYGIMAYSVSQRTNEIGIRMALGAEPGRVLRMVLGEASWMTALGIVVGVGGALALRRLIASMLYGLKPWDPVTYVGTVLLLGLVALGATWIPARRAAGVDPMRALRHE